MLRQLLGTGFMPDDGVGRVKRKLAEHRYPMWTDREPPARRPC